MNTCWVLSVKTSLPNGYIRKAEDIRTEIFAFSDFQAAKQALEHTLKKFAFSSNSMFDGKGNLIYLNKYIDNVFPDEDDDLSGSFLSRGMWLKIHRVVAGICRGEAVDISEVAGEYIDGMMIVKFTRDLLTMYGYGDGLYNGYSPVFSTNMLDLHEEKDYFFCLDDRFGQDLTSVLCLDLKKVEIR